MPGIHTMIHSNVLKLMIDHYHYYPTMYDTLLIKNIFACSTIFCVSVDIHTHNMTCYILHPKSFKYLPPGKVHLNNNEAQNPGRERPQKDQAYLFCDGVNSFETESMKK